VQSYYASCTRVKDVAWRPQDLADAAWLEGPPSDGPTEDAR